MMMNSLQVAILAVCVGSALAQVSTCVQGQNCSLPDCFCSTFNHPDFPEVKDIPQMVYFGFDDAVTVTVDKFYRQLFNEARTNPNGCPMTMSLYVQDQWTDYGLVSSEHQMGNEIGSHSVTHQNVDTKEKLIDEAGGQKDNLVNKGHVPRQQVVGWRSPNLKPAGDAQPEVLRSQGYTYDISLTYTRVSADDPAAWPYTLDYGYPFGCAVPPCPGKTTQHPGFWEIPINALYDPVTGYPCSYVDSCRPKDEADALEYLWSNFMRSYRGNRAPFGLNMHAAWFVTPHNLRATHKFLDRLQGLNDVYVVSAKQVLDWMRSPVKVTDVHKLAGWGCNKTPKPTTVLPLPTPVTRQSDTVTSTTTRRPVTSSNSTVVTSPRPVTVMPDVCMQETNCHRPDCQCRSIDPPVPLPLQDVPQMIMLTFMGTVDSVSYDALTYLLNTITTNPNGCPISATFFRPLAGNNERYLQELYNMGHELALYGTRSQHNQPRVDQQLLSGQAAFHRNIRRPERDINLGYRSATTFSVDPDLLRNLNTSGALYDSSLVMSRTVSQTDPLPWPYTLDFGWQDMCTAGINCPTERYPGLWEIPIVPLTDYKRMFTCVYPDACYNQPRLANETFHFLSINFDRHLHTNRAPMGIHLRKDWFSHPAYQANLQGLKDFLNYVLTRGDVYIVSVQKMLDWMRNPTALNRIGSQHAWTC